MFISFCFALKRDLFKTSALTLVRAVMSVVVSGPPQRKPAEWRHLAGQVNRIAADLADYSDVLLFESHL